MWEGERRFGEKRSAEMFTIVAVKCWEGALQDQKIEQGPPKLLNNLDEDKRNVKGLYSPSQKTHLKWFACS
jgi:hypothetical protein